MANLVVTGHPVTFIGREAVCDWLKAHGFDPAVVRSATIRIDHHLRDGVGVWLDVAWYLRDASGQLYPDGTGNEPAAAEATVPLLSWPPLQPAPSTDSGGG